MKKIITVIIALIFLSVFYSCSENSVSQNETKKSLSYSIRQVPDTLSIQFEAIDSSFTTADSSENLQFSALPKIFYEIKADTGYGSITLKNINDSVIFYKMFGGYVSDTATLQDIPWKYVFTTNYFIGKGNIKVTK